MVVPRKNDSKLADSTGPAGTSGTTPSGPVRPSASCTRARPGMTPVSRPVTTAAPATVAATPVRSKARRDSFGISAKQRRQYGDDREYADDGQLGTGPAGDHLTAGLVPGLVTVLIHVALHPVDHEVRL